MTARGRGAGPAARAHHAGGDGPAPDGAACRPSRKQSAVLRSVASGEDLELLSTGTLGAGAELSAWRDAFLAAGEASLKTRPADSRDAAIGRLKAKVGDLTMANELLATKIEHLQAGALWHAQVGLPPGLRPPPAEPTASCGWPGSG